MCAWQRDATAPTAQRVLALKHGDLDLLLLQEEAGSPAPNPSADDCDALGAGRLRLRCKHAQGETCRRPHAAPRNACHVRSRARTRELHPYPTTSPNLY